MVGQPAVCPSSGTTLSLVFNARAGWLGFGLNKLAHTQILDSPISHCALVLHGLGTGPEGPDEGREGEKYLHPEVPAGYGGVAPLWCG